MSYRFPYDPGLRGIRWVVESSDVLDDWENAEILFDSASEVRFPNTGEMLSLDIRLDDDRKFIRLRIQTLD